MLQCEIVTNDITKDKIVFKSFTTYATIRRDFLLFFEFYRKIFFRKHKFISVIVDFQLGKKEKTRCP